MKVLTIEAAFELPADFTGDLADAVVVLGEFLRSKRGSEPIARGDTRPFCPEIWEKFWKAPAESRVRMAAGIREERDR